MTYLFHYFTIVLVVVAIWRTLDEGVSLIDDKIGNSSVARTIAAMLPIKNFANHTSSSGMAFLAEFFWLWYDIVVAPDWEGDRFITIISN
jgi:hypothetical protein